MLYVGLDVHRRRTHVAVMDEGGHELFVRSGHPDMRYLPAERRGSPPSESAGGSHPPPLSGPDVTISRHPAPTVRPRMVVASCQWANRSGWHWRAFSNQAAALR